MITKVIDFLCRKEQGKHLGADVQESKGRLPYSTQKRNRDDLCSCIAFLMVAAGACPYVCARACETVRPKSGWIYSWGYPEYL